MAVGELQTVADYSTSAVQQGAGAALAVSYIVIPYCVSRALSEIGVARGLQQLGERLLARLEREPTVVFEEPNMALGSSAGVTRPVQHASL